MKKKLTHIYALVMLISLTCTYLVAVDETQEQATTEEQKPTTSKNSKNSHEKTVRFYYDQKDLVEVVNDLAEKMNVNVILPTGPNAITSKLTLHLNDRISLTEAWNMLYTILDIAGFSLIPKGDMFFITKTSPNTVKEPLPLYIGVAPDKLPNTDERIRYLYYLANIKVSDAVDSELGIVLKELLPDNASIKIDVATNALLITEKAANIRQAMKVVTEIDKSGFQESLEIITLKYASADIVAKLFNDSILRVSQDNRYRIGARRQQSEASYFSPQTRIVPILRNNSLIILGRTQAVERIKDFILKYVDVELDSGKSILHTYQLQYLDADDFQNVLQRVVDSTIETAKQSRGAVGATAGPEKFFEGGIIIKSDKPSGGNPAYSGGNKLVVAARNDDWVEIVKLIEKLDTPQPQVLIEVLIADLTLQDLRALSATTRNPATLNFSKDVNIQSAQASGVILDSDTMPTSGALATDLLRQGITNPIVAPDAPIPSSPTAGTSLISLSDPDGKTWSVLEMLNQYSHTKILSHPHVMAINNERASISVGQTRLLDDEASGSASATTLRKKEITANLSVDIIPRISSANEVNLDVTININEFQGEANQRLTRNIKTSANVKDTQVLALGGLVRVDTLLNITQTPLLGKLPIIGWLFKGRRDRQNKTNLTIFIAPKIVQPKLRGGIGEYTKDYINLTKTYSKEGALFEELRDPITRWFFKTETDAQEVIDSFTNQDEFKQKAFSDSFALETEPKDRKPKTKRELRKEKQLALEMERREKKEQKQLRKQLAQKPNTTSLKELLAHEENPLAYNKDKSKESSIRSI